MAARKTPSGGGKPDKIMRDAISVELHGEVQANDPSGSGRVVKLRRMRLVAIALVNAAIKGDISAIKEINDRMDGRVVQQHAGLGKDGAFPLDVRNLQDMSDDVLNALIDRIGRALRSPRGAAR